MECCFLTQLFTMTYCSSTSLNALDTPIFPWHPSIDCKYDTKIVELLYLRQRLNPDPNKVTQSFWFRTIPSALQETLKNHPLNVVVGFEYPYDPAVQGFGC
ncbi:hypothetical protein AMECASPLE_037140 [Ameca splendens]|uniref:Uncharacterized protein n=1 Tax=Ameca splendens TaxID=208324 RepID=A0ABV0Y8D3_9TELE